MFEEGIHYRVDADTGCHVWLRAKNIWGYGMVSSTRGSISGSRLAHRVAYEAACGAVPDGLDLDHLCRVRACINPDHLEPVTRATNLQRGKTAKLNWETVKEIRRIGSLSGRPTHRVLAKLFNIDHRCIGRILRNESWKEE